MRVSAITTATAWPTKRTVSGAIAGQAPIFIGAPSLEWIIQPQIRLPILSSTSLLAGEHGNHARHLHRLGGVDAPDPGVGVRAAHERGIGHAVQADIVDVAALAGDETLVFLAHHPCANAFNAHDLGLPTGVLLSAIPIEIRRS